MDNLQGQLCNFMDNCFEKVKTPDQTIMLINRFEKLDIPCLRDEIVHKYELYALRYKVKYSRVLSKLRFEIQDRLDQLKADYNDRRQSNDWHVPQDWPKLPGIVRDMEFRARKGWAQNWKTKKIIFWIICNRGLKFWNLLKVNAPMKLLQEKAPQLFVRNNNSQMGKTMNHILEIHNNLCRVSKNILL